MTTKNQIAYPMKGLFVFLFTILPLLGLTQSITVSGKVVDKETGEALGFASVGIKGKPVGTISNFVGEFDFHFSPEYRNEILVISMIGYSNVETPIWTLPSNQFQTIFMEKSSVLLPEVFVVDSLQGSDILRLALANIDKNYPSKPFLLDGFYRDVKKVGGTNISLLEAAVKIYDEDYSEPRNKYKLRERVQLIELRRSVGYENKFTDYFDQDNLLEDLLLHNNIRYRQIEAEEELFESMTRQEDSNYDGREIYVIKRSKDYNLTFYIDKQDYAIVHMEYSVGPSGDIITKKKNLISKFSGIKKSIDFKRYGGILYLNYMTMTSTVNWYDINTNALKFEAELFQQLLINQVHVNTKERINANQKMHSYSLQYQDRPYNKKFWDNYNVIKDSPLDDKVLQDMEKQIPLDKQFEHN